MHRIRSWAKAHASISGNSQQEGSSGTTTPSQEADEPPIRNDQVNDKPAGDPTRSGSPSDGEKQPQKPGLLPRMQAGSVRFVRHTKTALCHSWVNVLLVFVPIGIAAEAVGLNPAIIFAMNAVAIIPLAGILSHATECVASRLGDTIGALLNVTFGNAVELIIFIIALVKDQIRIVQASLLGSILANLLLILGMAFLLGGLRFQEQIYNSTVTQMSACLLSLAVTSLLLPTAFHASFKDSAKADSATLKVSRGTSVVLLLVYVLYIVFQLKSHSYLYASIPQQVIDEESHPGVLADFMNSSSESSSSSSSDESDDTTTSWTTAKRLKRAVKYRRHRKFSTTSRDTSSPDLPRKSSLNDVSSLGATRKPSSTSASSPSQRDDAGSYIVDFGDDNRPTADPVSTSRSTIEPQARDFGQPATSIKFDEEDRGHHTRERKTRKKVRKQREKAERTEKLVVPAPTDPRVSSLAADEGVGTVDSPKKWSPFRPGLPSLLSNTVFTNPPPTAGNSRGDPLGNFNGLRRTHSLPSLSQPPAHHRQPPVGNAVQFARVAARMPDAVNPAAPQPQEHPEPEMSRTAAIVMLLLSTALVAVCAEFLVDAIPEMVESSSVSEAFIGLIILPIVGNAAEHVTAVTVATKNKMDLSIGVSVGSSIQIAIFVTPLVVILGWCMDKDMNLYFTLFETISLFVTVFVVNFLVLDGKSNYLEGALLIAAYVIISVAAFFYPDEGESSALGGG
ncbi:Putative Ca2 /H antiporter VCX1 and related proteins [Aspergillus calidoustus]|uniref:Putative Ca2 /H antiporter VCX1 and related proteins n=1 Tax=Aspergillus calidoustus TaxID=454130 RepID=A0A0U5FS98_ASPCI|nr:Putative Ca2 /H antiporter VCX1 and related proteins [Aspergillus calidoustus]